jgi:hypothetical protein
MTAPQPVTWYPYDPTAFQPQPVPAPTPPAKSGNKWRKPTLLAGIATALVTATLIGVFHGGRSGSSLCADYAALAQYQHLDPYTASAGQLLQIDHLMHKLANEAPISARRDLLVVARSIDDVVATGDSSEDVQAAADHADAVLSAKCVAVRT